MKGRPLGAILLAAIAAAVCAAGGCSSPPCDGPTCSAPMDAAPGSGWDVVHEFTLEAGSLAEAAFDMAPGAKLRVELAVSHVIEWDVHSHSESGVVTTHLGGRDSATEYEFTAATAGTYYTLWSNTLSDAKATITVRIALTGQATLTGWR